MTIAMPISITVPPLVESVRESLTIATYTLPRTSGRLDDEALECEVGAEAG